MYIFVPSISDPSHFSLMMSGNKNFPRANIHFCGFHQIKLSFANTVLCFLLCTHLWKTSLVQTIKIRCHFSELNIFISKCVRVCFGSIFKSLSNSLQTYGNLKTSLQLCIFVLNITNILLLKISYLDLQFFLMSSLFFLFGNNRRLTSNCKKE